MSECPHCSIESRESRLMGSNCVIAAFLCIASVAFMAIGLALEHRARMKLEEEHDSLERQLDQMARLTTENGQLSHLLVRASFWQSETSLPSRELLRLRGQIGVLRQQTKELESVRNENRQFRA